jgi:DNA repair photolyase
MTRMFKGMVTWNPGYGCPDHKCPYCWVPGVICRQGRERAKAFREGKVYLDERKLAKGPPNAEVVFVWAHGDMWSRTFPRGIREEVLGRLRISHHKSKFVFFTKNPQGYIDYFKDHYIDDRFVFGVTVETNHQYAQEVQGDAPPPLERMFTIMRGKNVFQLSYISVEPIMDFDAGEFAHWLILLNPVTVYIGYDSKHKHLPEPSLAKTVDLINDLTAAGINVERKLLRERWN